MYYPGCFLLSDAPVILAFFGISKAADSSIPPPDGNEIIFSDVLSEKVVIVPPSEINAPSSNIEIRIRIEVQIVKCFYFTLTTNLGRFNYIGIRI